MTKQAKLLSQARLPALAKPPATPTRSDSAMPTLKNRGGNFLAKRSVRVELWTSPSTTTMSGYCSPALARAMPKDSRTDLPCFMAWVLAGEGKQLQNANCKMQIANWKGKRGARALLFGSGRHGLAFREAIDQFPDTHTEVQKAITEFV